MTEENTRTRNSEGEQTPGASRRDEHDSGMRIRGEAPATGRIEANGGVIPNVPPAELDSQSPGSLQGSPTGLGPAMAGVMPISGEIDRRAVGEEEELTFQSERDNERDREKR